MDLITAEQGAHAGDGFIETLSCSSMEKLITKSNRLTDSVVRRQVDAGDQFFEDSSCDDNDCAIDSQTKKTGSLVQSSGDRLMPETQDAEIHAEEDVTKARKDSADTMKVSRNMRKWVSSRISLVEMSLGLTAPGMW